MFDEALREADQNYVRSKEQAPAWSWRFQTQKAQVLQFEGKLQEALSLLEAQPPANFPVDVRARGRITQADTLCRLGKSQIAEPMLAEAQALISTSDRSLQAELTLARGRCAINSRTLAKQYFTSAANQAHDVDEFVEAAGLLNAGSLLLQDKQYRQAIDNFRSALRLTESPFLNERALGNLGFIYSELGEFQRAAYFSEQALKISKMRRNLGYEKKWLIDLGREHFSQLEYSQAEASFRDALAIARELQDPEDTATCLNNLAHLALRVDDMKKADDYTRQLEDLRPKGSHYLDLLLDQAELVKAREELPAAERLLKQLLEQMAELDSPEQPGIDAATRWIAQSDLAAVYAAEGKFDLADDMFRKAVAAAEAARKKIEGVEYRISFLDQAPFYDRYVKFLMSRSRSLEALDVAELGRSPTLSEGLESGERKSLRGPRLEIIQQRLRAQHGIVLAYWLGWEESYLWAITPSQVKAFRLYPELVIEKEAAAYNREIVDREPPEKSRSGEKLYDLLIRPAAALIPKGGNVIIVPHRKLYNLNFETILVPDPKPHYWIEDVHLQNASFLGALANHKAGRSKDATRDLLLVGAPVLADKRYPVLKNAGAEMEKVASHFPQPRETVITGSQATPQAYLSSNPGQFNLLHFVTHGTSSTVLESALDSAIILSPAQGNSAPAGDPEASYHLYGKDIMGKPLHAELVTISACYGLGREFSGEGLVGLAWAFMRAGAHQVIAALWEVDDASTPQLMDDFYTELSQGKSAAEALRDAKLKMLHSSDFHRHPYYWASLQLYTGS